MKQYDVGIFGLWFGRNYGSISTYFALKTVVEGLGYSTVMIENPLNREPLDVDLLPPSHPCRFAYKRYATTKRLPLEEMGQLNDVCRAFLLGSDQLWNYYLSRGYKHAYFLDFVRSDRLRIAYGPSFGKRPYNGPASEFPIMANELAKFRGISVRDDFSKLIVEEDLGLPAEQVMDPVFLCPRSAYEGLIQEAEPLPEEPFVFGYILDPNPEIGASLLKILEASGKRMVLVFDEPKDDQEMFRRLEISDPRITVLESPPVNRWLACFRKADFVVTDSFHGACFSIVFQRPFVVHRNPFRGSARFACLLEPLGLTDRMALSPEELWEKYSALAQGGRDIDYGAVASRLAPERDRSLNWLKEALRPIRTKAVTGALPRSMCAGCGACQAACPQGAISLKPDAWGYKRAEVDFDRCVECGLCARACPSLHPPKTGNSARPECYAFVSPSDQELRASSSGGIFGTLAREVLTWGGAVAGAAWREDLTVEHIVVESEADLRKLQKSKYLQSDMSGCLPRVKEILEEGRQVLFSGTPCQVAGLRSYLGRDYENLITLDIFCSYVPSQKFFKKYAEGAFPQGLQSYEFRHKKPEWNWDCLTVKATDASGREIVRRGPSEDAFQRAFHNHTMCPEHCENCRFQSAPRCGDLSMGDFWGIEKKDGSLETQKGVSALLLNSRKGEIFAKPLLESSAGVARRVPLEWVGKNGFSFNGGRNYAPGSRDLFFRAILTMPFKAAVNYALKPNHGQYREAYRDTNSPLQYDCNMLRFHFEGSVWEETAIEGRPTLIVKENQWRETGHFARLSLAGMLDPDKTYRLSAKFRIRTASDQLAFHLMDSGSKRRQVVRIEKLGRKNAGQHWIEFSQEFTPDADFYDEVAFGAAQVSGSLNFLSIAYINISEVPKGAQEEDQ